MAPSGEVETVNKPNLEYFGKTLEDLRKWGTSDAVHPDDLPHAIEIWMEAIQTGQPYDVKQRLRRFDGVYRWFGVHGFPLRDPDGRILNWCVLLTDIDDRERAEQALRVVVETATDAVVSADESGAIQFANPATTRVFGYDPAELIGKPLTVLMPEFMRKLHENGFRRYLATGQRHINWQGTEFTGLRKNGQEFQLEVSFGELMTMAHAAAHTIATVEKMHDGNLMDDPALSAGTVPGFYVETVALAPRGAWPLPLLDHYAADGAHLAEYARLAATAEGFSRYLEQYVYAKKAA